MPPPSVLVVTASETAFAERASTGDTGVTLAELLGVPEFRLTCITGRDGLDRDVRWAHSTELLDPSQYLRGGELICTVGTSLVNDDACARFVSSVNSARASGICFGTGDVHDDVPAAFVTSCLNNKMPLLIAPVGVPFNAIGEYLAQRRVHAEAIAAERDSRLLVELLAHVRRQATTAQLLDLTVRALGGHLVLSESGRALNSSGRIDAASSPLSAVSAESPDGAALTWSGTGSAPSQMLLATLAQVLDVARHERDVEQDLHRERVGQLLALVGDRLANPSALAQTLADAGLPMSGLVFAVWPPGASRVLASSLEGLPLVLGETPSATMSVSASSDPVRAVAEQLGVVCGMSRPVLLADSGSGIGEARAAFEVARRNGGCVGPEGLTSLDGLLEQQPPERLKPFVDQLLRPLTASDARGRTSYVRTLVSFLRNDGSLTETARTEFLHVNTVRHRLERIRELTGRDPLRFDDRVALAIALWAHHKSDSEEA